MNGGRGRKGFAGESSAAEEQCGAQNTDQVLHFRPPCGNDGTARVDLRNNQYQYRLEGKPVAIQEW